jgi:hypothetical protein
VQIHGTRATLLCARDNVMRGARPSRDVNAPAGPCARLSLASPPLGEPARKEDGRNTRCPAPPAQRRIPRLRIRLPVPGLPRDLPLRDCEPSTSAITKSQHGTCIHSLPTLEKPRDERQFRHLREISSLSSRPSMACWPSCCHHKFIFIFDSFQASCKCAMLNVRQFTGLFS